MREKEYSRECLAIQVARKLTAQAVLHRRGGLFLARSLTDYVRSDNGPDFSVRAVHQWLEQLELGPLRTEPTQPRF